MTTISNRSSINRKTLSGIIEINADALDTDTAQIGDILIQNDTISGLDTINFKDGIHTASIGLDTNGDLQIDGTGELKVTTDGVNMEGETLNMNAGEIHNVPLIHGRNNENLVIEAKGTGDIVFETNNVNRMIIDDTGIVQITNGLVVSGSSTMGNIYSSGIGTFAGMYGITLQATSASFSNIAMDPIKIGINAGQNTQGDSAVAIGNSAGSVIQGLYSVAIGVSAGQNTQGIDCIAIGRSSGRNNQGQSAVSIGLLSGQTSQASNAIAIGNSAGSNTQGFNAIAIGQTAGVFQQGQGAVSIGQSAGNGTQGFNAIGIGAFAGSVRQGSGAIALGFQAGENTQGQNAIAIGSLAGEESQASGAIAIGNNAGEGNQALNAIAIGNFAGENSQQNNAISIGANAGQTNQGSGSIAIGNNAGDTNQQNNTIAMGVSAGENTQGVFSIAIGDVAGRFNQGSMAIAIGRNAGNSNQASMSVSIGFEAGEVFQGGSAIAIGRAAGEATQGQNSVAIGNSAGRINQSTSSVAIGNESGRNTQGANAVAIGNAAGNVNQGNSSVAIGVQAGMNTQGWFSVAVGRTAGEINQGSNAVALGMQAGQNFQGSDGIAIGLNAGCNTQGINAVAIGESAGFNNQGTEAVAIGQLAGRNNQGINSIALGFQAAQNTQGSNAIAIGFQAGFQVQGGNAISIGREAGENTQGQNAIAIGTLAGRDSQHANSIILNASGSLLNSATQSATYINPIRQQDGISTGVLSYNSTSGEITHSQTLNFDNGVLVVDMANNRVGVGIATPERGLHYRGDTFRMDRDGNTSGFQIHRWAPGYTSIWKGFQLGVDASASNTGEFFIGDYGTAVSGSATRRLTINNTGDVIIPQRVSIGTTNAPTQALDVSGISNFGGIVGINDNQLRLRLPTDGNHFLAYKGTGNTFESQAPDGPVLAGYDGGILGTTNGAERVCMEWFSNRNVRFRGQQLFATSDSNTGQRQIIYSGFISVGGTVVIQKTKEFRGDYRCRAGNTDGNWNWRDAFFIGTSNNTSTLTVNIGGSGTSPSVIAGNSGTDLFYQIFNNTSHPIHYQLWSLVGGFD